MRITYKSTFSDKKEEQNKEFAKILSFFISTKFYLFASKVND